MLIEDSDIVVTALPVEDFKAHLRLGRGFAGDTVQDVVLESFLRAALSAIEGRTGKALITRNFTWVQAGWKHGERQIFPIAPVSQVTQITILGTQSGPQVVDPARYQLEQDLHFPALCGRGAGLPLVSTDGSVRIEFTAGFGPGWSDLPPDLAQAVLLLAAHYYEHREATGLAGGCMPFGVTSLMERYRPLRLISGGRR